MIDIEFIKENKSLVEKSIRDRGKPPVDLEKVINLYKERTSLLREIDDINRTRRTSAEKRDTEAGKLLKEKLKEKESRLRTVMSDFIAIMSVIPNIPSADTPIGKDESGNVVLRTEGEKKSFSFSPKPHWELGEALGIIDSKRAATVAGARFTYLKGDLVRIQNALHRFSLSVVTNESILKKIIDDNNLSLPSTPFIEVLPPVFIRPEVLHGMARLEPKEDRFHIESENLYLIGSAEHTLGPLHIDEVLKDDTLPRRYVGFSTAFRREAGSYGKDTRGILRQHQFDKLEMQSFTNGTIGIQEQNFLVAIQEYIVSALRIPYQVVQICTGDMGDPDQRQIDIEMWMPGQGVYRETHSADYNGSYQSRRLNIRVEKEGKKELAHMNDATLIAMGRALIAILENYQNEDGSVTVPEILQSEVGHSTIRPIN